ncbi:putative serine/threonine-protein kinase, partial [Trichostrongylus colubriformis]
MGSTSKPDANMLQVVGSAPKDAPPVMRSSSKNPNTPQIPATPSKNIETLQVSTTAIVNPATPQVPTSTSKDANTLQIGMIITHKVGRWKVLRNIASGPFSEVFVVVDADNNKTKYAMKCEKQEGNQRPVLKLDVMVLMSVKGSVGFPLFIAAGRTKIYRYCVMQLVGPDLGKLRRSLVAKRFSVPTALRVLQQTLRRLEVLHDAGWLCRDVKAPNFAVGLGHENSIIYMLDFGFARKYKDANGQIYPPREAAALLGTFQ